ncbi:shikimate dehydrogenase [Paenibacillus arenosi]|uniref:Shikimate dehydrogenase (NADP(+)) n=1 Tax=Paenibacillus arenosi TaxID=2774142 RepID=A0ABR9B0S0_9BACL|nr:shikimate dehydrogenase [Paenibacillus arenosi]MBD8499042.1 shikimate dehydrogenase [Paenibacillus arenosi]
MVTPTVVSTVSTFLISSNTQLLAVIGDPIRQSKSPLMHNAALQACHWDGVYTAFQVPSEQLEQAIAGMRALGIKGMNVTIPHKEQVIHYLDQLDESASASGAVNTIVNDNGTLIGYNTDGLGYVRSLKEESGVDVSSASILIIGAGGAARGIAYALLREGCHKLYVANRTQDRAIQLAEDLAKFGTVFPIGIDEGIPDLHPDEVNVVIQTTSVGMHPNVDESPVAGSWLRQHMVVSDIIYNPLRTKLLQSAEQLGATVHEGLGMFVYQGAIAFELWTQQPAPTALMRQTVYDTLGK